MFSGKTHPIAEQIVILFWLIHQLRLFCCSRCQRIFTAEECQYQPCAETTGRSSLEGVDSYEQKRWQMRNNQNAFVFPTKAALTKKWHSWAVRFGGRLGVQVGADIVAAHSRQKMAIVGDQNRWPGEPRPFLQPLLQCQHFDSLMWAFCFCKLICRSAGWGTCTKHYCSCQKKHTWACASERKRLDSPWNLFTSPRLAKWKTCALQVGATDRCKLGRWRISASPPWKLFLVATFLEGLGQAGDCDQACDGGNPTT